MRRVAVFLFAAALVAAVPASAQDERRVHINLGSGGTITTGELNNHLGSGYNVNVGLTFNLTPAIGFMAEYSFNGMGQKQLSVPVVSNPIAGAPSSSQPFFADMNMQYGDFNLVVKPPLEGRIRPYVTTGLGIYYRPIKVTTPGLGYVPGYCDPFWYYCSPGGYVPVENIIGERSSTDFGINFGGGLDFRVSPNAAFYVEMRYHYIWGPTFTANSQTYNSNSAFFPITFGVRF